MSKTSYKITLIGDGCVGKTSLMKYIKSGKFDPKYLATIGVEAHTLPNIATNNDGDLVSFACWDTAGQEKFSGIAYGYYIQSDLCLSVCSSDSRTSYRALTNWETSFKRVCPDIPIIRVVNKIDSGHLTVIGKLEGFGVYPISVKEGTNIDGLLIKICEELGLKINRDVIENGTYISKSIDNISNVDYLVDHSDGYVSDENEDDEMKNVVILRLADNLSKDELEVIHYAEYFYGTKTINVTDKNKTIAELLE